MNIDPYPDAGHVLLLNGPPSCGKTALADALQTALERPYFHRSLDDFRAGYLDRWWQEDHVSLFRRVLDGYLGALRAMALAGNSLIAEAVITPSRLDQYLAVFDGLRVTFVGVRCTLEVARAREAQRVDRRHGPLELPAEAFAAVHSHGVYDIEVDTTTATAHQLATEIAASVHSSPDGAFDYLRNEAAR